MFLIMEIIIRDKNKLSIVSLGHNNHKIGLFYAHFYYK